MSRLGGWQRRRVWVVVWTAVVASVATALAWVAGYSSLLAVDDIEVTGEQRLTSTAVVQAAGVKQDTPLVRVDLDAVRQRVASLRVVEAATVRRAWPATLRISVEERKAVAAVPQDSRYVLLDEDGVRVDVTTKPPPRLPVVRISGRVVAPAAGGSSQSMTGGAGGGTVSSAAARPALRVVSELPAGLADKVRAAAVADGSRVTLRLQNGARVKWGRPTRTGEKANVLRAMLREYDAREYDVSSPEVATTG